MELECEYCDGLGEIPHGTLGGGIVWADCSYCWEEGE